MATRSERSERASASEEVRALVSALGVERARELLFARHRLRIDAIALAHRLPRDRMPPHPLLAADAELAHLGRLIKALRFLEAKAAQAPIRGGRAHDLARLAWLATRPGRRGAEALVVLQDALHARYPEAFDAAIAHAHRRARRTGRPAVVVFSTSMERGVRTHLAPDTQAFYRKNHWPFVVGTDPSRWRERAPVVWDTDRGADVHGWVNTRTRRAAEEREDDLARRELVGRLLAEADEPWDGTLADARAILRQHDYPWTRRVAEAAREIIAERRSILRS